MGDFGCKFITTKTFITYQTNYKPMTETTSLSVTHSVRERVKRCAEFKDETYSSILDRVMDEYESTSDHIGNCEIIRGDRESMQQIRDFVNDPTINAVQVRKSSNNKSRLNVLAFESGENGATIIAIPQDIRDRLQMLGANGEFYDDVLTKIMDVYERTQWSPARIEAANDPEDSGAEHIIALALEVIRDEIPDTDSYARTGIPTEDGEHE